VRARLGPLARAARLAGPRRGHLAASAALGAAAVAAACALLAVSGYLISRAAQQPAAAALTLAILAVRVAAMTRAGLRYGERLVSHDLALRVLADLRVRFFARLAPLVPAGLGGAREGDVLSRYVADVDRLQDLYLRALHPPLVAALGIAGAGLAAALLLPAAGAVLAVGLLVAGLLVPALTAGAAAAAGRRQAPARAHLSAELTEMVRGSAELAVFGREAEWAERAAEADRRLVAVSRRDALAGGLAAGAGTLCAGALVLAVALVAVPAAHDGSLDAVLVAAVVLLALGAYEAVAPLPPAAQSLHACASAAARLEEITEAPVPVRDPPRPRALPPGGELVAESVVLRYAARGAPALDGVSLRVAPGRRVAVVGPSGAGKSTLAELLVRLRDPDRGVVRLGGRDIRELAQADVRAAVRLGDQDAHLFSATLRDNVVLARPGAGDDAVRGALERAGLREWLDALPAGLDTFVGEEGAHVSGGQRRRIAVARGLLANCRVLVLDEPAAHLDPAGSRALLEGLADRDDPRGMLVISHAIAGLERFDEILVLEAGRVVGHGPPLELVARGGAYARLAIAQGDRHGSSAPTGS
jgi:thiol reductant ABC exporter CydC subunit